MADIEGSLYYTLRKAGALDKPTFELTKWSDLRDRPLDVYAQWLPQSGGVYRMHSCNCPSRLNPCKHAEISLALLSQPGGANDLEHYYWADGNVRLAEDL